MKKLLHRKSSAPQDSFPYPQQLFSYFANSTQNSFKLTQGSFELTTLQIELPNSKHDLLPLEGSLECGLLTLHFWVFNYASYVRSTLFDHWFYTQQLKGQLTPRQKENYRSRSHYFKTDSQAGARLKLTLPDGRQYSLTSDQEGHVYIRVPWYTYTFNNALHLLFRNRLYPLKITVPSVPRANVVGSRPVYRLLISDIDDTIKITGVLNKHELLENTFLNDFVQVPGMASKYHQLVTTNQIDQIHYVSSSPWQLYPSLVEFLESQGFPQVANINLRKLVAKEMYSLVHFINNSFEYKVTTITHLLQKYLAISDLEVVLVGDSGEKDPEVYNQIALMYPTIVKKIIIRSLPSDPFSFKEQTPLLQRFHPSLQSRVATYTNGYDFQVV